MNKLHLRLIYKLILFTMIFFIGCGFQTSFWPNIISFLPSPQIWLIVIFYIGIKWKSLNYIFYIYFLSYCLTLFTDVPLKMLWVPLALIYFILILVKDRIRLTGVFSFILYSLVGSVMFEVGYYFISSLLEPVPTSILFVDRTLQVLMNFILSYPLYFVLEFADRALSEKPDWHRSSMDHHNESLL
ncbi:MAG: hypothetical protein K2P92_07240 [Bdellovibrionaceae bacterium]|nr:hypothetical protein [Pseudobdellovibrionaceae bacterium]